jgi:hypothetical protein
MNHPPKNGLNLSPKKRHLYNTPAPEVPGHFKHITSGAFCGFEKVKSKIHGTPNAQKKYKTLETKTKSAYAQIQFFG